MSNQAIAVGLASIGGLCIGFGMGGLRYREMALITLGLVLATLAQRV